MRRSTLFFAIAIIILLYSTVLAQESRPNRVLSLGGGGDYVEIADSEALNNIDSQVTMEAWIKPTDLVSWMPIIYKGDKRSSNFSNRSYGLWINGIGHISSASAPSGEGQKTVRSLEDLITPNKWFHAAGVIDAKNDFMSMFINGIEIARGSFGKDIYVSKLPLRIGWNETYEYFAGQIDEVRIWRVARTQEDIRRTMHTTLSGKEPDLVGYWSFDDVGSPTTRKETGIGSPGAKKDVLNDLSPSRAHGRLMGDAHLVEEKLPSPDELPIPTVISGIVEDDAGRPFPGVVMHLKQDNIGLIQTETNDSGNYWIAISNLPHGLYNLFATKGEQGDLHLGITLDAGKRQVLNFRLKEAISISGVLLMMDNRTPHVSVVVQAIQDGKTIATALSDEDGKYQFINLKPGRYQVRCQVLDGYVYYGENRTSKPISSSTYSPINLQVKQGKSLKNIDFRFAPFKKGSWKNYGYLDGLMSSTIKAIYRDPNGILWFGTDGGGLLRYDGKTFVNFGKEDGLEAKNVRDIHSRSGDVLWLATEQGAYRYDGKEFINFTTEDGLVGNKVNAVYQDSEGAVWFGTAASGVSRFDSKEFISFTEKDGLADNAVTGIYQSSDGAMWFATWWGGGVSRYDGKEFVRFTERDGLAYSFVRTIYQDSSGIMWFGTDRGVSMYDGNEFVSFTRKDGLATGRDAAEHDFVNDIYQDSDGAIWFATLGGGVSRYDGEGFVNFTAKDGLINNHVRTIFQDATGSMWFGTSDGLSRYDTKTFVNITEKDGLPASTINSTCLDPDGILWIGTDGSGVVRYDSQEVVALTMEDGLAANQILSVYCERDGIFWFGTNWRGLSRYDGRQFTNFTARDGLASSSVGAIYQSSDGAMWFSGRTSVSRYDGQKFTVFTEKDGLTGAEITIHQSSDGTIWLGSSKGLHRYNGKKFINFTTRDGLPDIHINVIYQDFDNTIWLGTDGDGVLRYHNQKFTNLTMKDGLSGNRVLAIHRSNDNKIWFGTHGAGVSCYDGIAWSSLDTRDGLVGNTVKSIHQDADGLLWFGMNDGLTHYRPGTTQPKAFITSVKIEKSTYTDLAAIPSVTVGDDVIIEYSAIDLRTIPEKRQYRYYIKELDSNWRKPTKSAQFEWTPEKPGTYIFAVQAIDRDLNYSEPASMELTIKQPPVYTRTGFIIGVILMAFFIPTAVFGGLLLRQRRQTFEPIQNPYIVGNPIRSKEMFFGRQADFEFVRAKLATGQSGLVIVFAGERRSGKTSILFQILGGALGEQFVPVLLDMQAMAVDNEAEFLTRIASGIEEGLVKADYAPSSDSVDFHTGNPVYAFEQFIGHAMEALSGKSLLLLLDEYELMETKIDDSILRPDLITFFASLLEAHSGLSLIFTGSQHLGGRNRDYWSILIGKSLYRHISFLSEQDALRLITEPVADRVTYPRGIPERIVRLTAGQPFYTQVVCQNLVDKLNEVERSRVRQEDIDAVARELSENPLPQMVYFWDGLEGKQQTVLAYLGEVLDDSNRYASARMSLDFAKEHDLSLEPDLSDLERLLNNLFINEVLERERAGEGQYEYRFKADLFRLWIRQAHSIWDQSN